MLTSAPVGVSKNKAAFWRKMRPLSVEQLRTWWRLVESTDLDLIDNENAEYREWVD